jgi:hypothetical protein
MFYSKIVILCGTLALQPILRKAHPMFDFVTFTLYKNVGSRSKTCKRV